MKRVLFVVIFTLFLPAQIFAEDISASGDKLPEHWFRTGSEKIENNKTYDYQEKGTTVQ